MRYKTYTDSQRGVSMMEVLVSVFILSVVGAGVAAFQIDVFRVSRIVSNGQIAQDEARRAMRSMTREVRTASPSSNGAYAISQAATSSFTFFSNIDSDSLKEQVRYFMSGKTLRKGVIKPTGTPLVYNSANERFSTLANNVVNSTSTPIFYYFDTNYDGTSAALSSPVNVSAVRLVKMLITIDNDMNSPPAAITLTTQISIRNIKDNL